MKIVFQKNVINEAVTNAMCAVSTKNTIPSIQGFLFKAESGGRCFITSFDLDKGTRTVIEAQADAEASFILNAQRFSQIIKMMPENTITLTVENGTATITSGRTEFEMSSMDAQEFPSIPELECEYGFNIKQKDLSLMIQQTLFAVSQSNQRPVFTGAMFDISSEKIIAAGCDGYRLSVKESSCEITDMYEGLRRKVVIPGKSLSELLKLMSDGENDIRIKLSNKHVIFEIKEKNIIFFSRLLEGEYVDFDRLIPQNFNTYVYADTELLISAFERASLISEENTSSGSKSFVKIKVCDGMLDISSVSAKGRVHEEVSVEKEGEDMELGFSCRYLLDALRASKSEKVKLSFVSPLISIIVEPAEQKENEKLTMLVLPIKLR